MVSVRWTNMACPACRALSESPVLVRCDLTPLWSVLSSRLASSLTDLYSADMEEDKNSPYSPFLPPSSVSLSPSSPLALPPPCNYASGPHSIQHEVNNNNSTVYGGSVAPPTGKGSSFILSSRPGPQDFSQFRGQGTYAALKGPSGRYLSRSIPVSPLTKQQLSLCTADWSPADRHH